MQRAFPAFKNKIQNQNWKISDPHHLMKCWNILSHAIYEGLQVNVKSHTRMILDAAPGPIFDPLPCKNGFGVLTGQRSERVNHLILEINTEGGLRQYIISVSNHNVVGACRLYMQCVSVL